MARGRAGGRVYVSTPNDPFEDTERHSVDGDADVGGAFQPPTIRSRILKEVYGKYRQAGADVSTPNDPFEDTESKKEQRQ